MILDAKTAPKYQEPVHLVQTQTTELYQTTATVYPVTTNNQEQQPYVANATTLNVQPVHYKTTNASYPATKAAALATHQVSV